MVDRGIPRSSDRAVNSSRSATSHVALADSRAIDRNGESTGSRRRAIDSSDEREGGPQLIRFSEAGRGRAY
jgi:hypothetical protein